MANDAFGADSVQLNAVAVTTQGTKGTASYNPLTGLFESYRSAVLYGSSPAAIDLLYPVAVALVLLAICLPLYRAEQRHLAKIL